MRVTIPTSLRLTDAAGRNTVRAKRVPKKCVDLQGRELGEFKIGERVGTHERNNHPLWSCFHITCGNTTIISSQVLLVGAPKFCEVCRPAKRRDGWHKR